MTNFKRIFAIMAVLLLVAVDVAANEQASGGGRETWDEVMLWINFCILVFVIVKYGRDPLMDFLRSRRIEVKRRIGKIEQEKSEIDAKILETRKALDESTERFENLKKRIVIQGERKKKEIIEDAKRQSEMMMTTAKQKIGSRIQEAKDSFRAELVDAAMDLAEKKLPREITEEDNEKILEKYLSIT